MLGIAARYRDESGDTDSLRIYPSRPCSYVDLDTAEFVGIAGSSVLVGEKFTQIALGVSSLEGALLGPAIVYSVLLGSKQPKRNG